MVNHTDKAISDPGKAVNEVFIGPKMIGSQFEDKLCYMTLSRGKTPYFLG